MKEKSSFNWFYLVVIVIIAITIYPLLNTSTTQTINEEGFFNYMKAGKIKNVIVYNDVEEADVFLTPEAKKASVKSKEKSPISALQQMQKEAPDYSINIGDVKYFQENFDKIKSENPKINTQMRFDKKGSALQDILIQALIWFGIMALIYYFLFRKMGSGGGPGGQIFSIGKSRAKLFDENEKVQVLSLIHI